MQSYDKYSNDTSVINNFKQIREARFALTSLPCDSLGVRTQDPNIKSVVLYRLS